jgi:hypothetical protein
MRYPHQLTEDQLRLPQTPRLTLSLKRGGMRLWPLWPKAGAALAAMAEGRRGPLEGEHSTDGLVRANMISRQPHLRMPDQDRDTVAVPNSRGNHASVTSVHNVSLDPLSTAVDNALKQLQSSDAWLTDNTIKLVQDAIRNTRARAGVIRPGAHTIDPLCIGEDGFPAPPMVPRHTIHLIVPLRHTIPYPHWTLALVDTERCRSEWYDPSVASNTYEHSMGGVAVLVKSEGPRQSLRL